MATPAETIAKATEAETMATQRDPQLHQVYVVYATDQTYKTGQEIEVFGYPPKDLRKGDRIVFIPFPPGNLTLTFKFGSNFVNKKTRADKISAQEPRTVERLKMTQAEFDDFKRDAEKEGWPQQAAAEADENAFPF